MVGTASLAHYWHVMEVLEKHVLAQQTHPSWDGIKRARFALTAEAPRTLQICGVIV